MNRRRIAALLAGAPLALGIAAPISSAPVYLGLFAAWSFDNATTLVAISCARTTERPAWSMPLTPQPLLSGGTAGYSKAVPVIDTVKLGSTVEWAAYGPDPSAPVLRSGCLDAAGQRGLHWGSPIISERAVVTPPPAGIPLAILPGESAATPVYAPGPTTTPAPATTTTETTAPSATSEFAAPTAQAPVYAGTPGYSASPSHPPTDTGGGTLWAAIFFGILTLMFAAVSRYTSHRVRTEDTLEKIPLRAHLYSGAAALMGLLAAANAPTSVSGFLSSAVLAVCVALVLSAQRAAHSGYRVSAVALIKAARSEWPAAAAGAAIGFIIGYVFGGGAASPGTLYGIVAGAAIGIGGAHLRGTKTRVAGWLIDAALVADVLNIRERDITETGEVVFTVTADDGFVVTTLNQTARSNLDGIEARCAQVAPYLMVVHADRSRVEVAPADAETVAHREAMANSGGLVGGAHSGAAWTGGSPAAAPDDGVDMHKPGTTGAAPDTIDLSQGWD